MFSSLTSIAMTGAAATVGVVAGAAVLGGAAVVGTAYALGSTGAAAAEIPASRGENFFARGNFRN